MSTRAFRWIGVALATAGAAASADGQESALPQVDGAVRMVYPAASNVCGTGDGILIREPDGSTFFVSGHVAYRGRGEWQAGEPPCRTGAVILHMSRTDSRWGDVRLRVGGPAPADVDPGVRDLGFFAGQDAAGMLVEAARAGDGSGRDLILAAAIAADAVIWPRLLEVARDRSLDAGTRTAAIHWLGRRVAREAVDALGGIIRDRTEEDRIREAAVFALSQLDDDRAVPLLIDVVRTSDDARVVRQALFWLADSEDPRALALFEEILSSPADRRPVPPPPASSSG